MLSIDTQSELDQTAGLVRYRRHKPEETSLYPIIKHHLPQFLSHLAEQGTQLPRFVTQEFDDYLACGRHHLTQLKLTTSGRIERQRHRGRVLPVRVMQVLA